MRKKLLIVITLVIILIGAFSYRVKIKNLFYDLKKPDLPAAVDWQKNENSTTSELIDESATENQTPSSVAESPALSYPKNNPLPDSYNLNVPFTSQAPDADWTETFNEACEEASIIMVDHFYQNQPLDKKIATAEILKSIDWEIANWHGHFDLTASQTKQLIEDYFGYQQVKIINNPTIGQIKTEIVENHPVIVPAAGRLLGNPYFRQPGPLYHMLVIKGFTKNQFITNDPGTKRGADYLYDFQTILDANHSWNEEDITKGEKQVLVIVQ